MTLGRQTVCTVFAAVTAFIAIAIANAQAPTARGPLDVARVLAARYPASPIMSYIPGVAWSKSLRLAELTKEDRWKEKPRREIQPFINGDKPALTQRVSHG